MPKAMKRLAPLFVGAATFVIALTLLSCAALTAYAAAGTLGTEEPQIYCTYVDSAGNTADGNKLTPGATYSVTFNIRDMKSASVIQVTASYPDTVTVDSSTVSQITDADTSFSSMGCLSSDGNIVFGYVSNNDDTSALTADGTSLFTVDVTFPQEATEDSGVTDAAKLIQVSRDPNLTFACADYADGYDDEYSLDANDEVPVAYPGQRSYMRCDVSPELTSVHNVNGELVVMTNSSGATDNTPVYGTYTVQLYTDSGMTVEYGSPVISSLNSGKNTFVIENVESGTYYAKISDTINQYALERSVIVKVNDSDVSGVIPMVVCDYDSSGTISAADAQYIYNAAGSGTLKDYCDLDGSGSVATSDAEIVYKFVLSAGYKTLTIE